MISSTVVSSFAQPDGGEGKVDPEEDPDGRPKKGKHVFISDAEVSKDRFHPSTPFFSEKKWCGQLYR
jgi:hypothetical protein